jgi:hypothetical protein
MSTVRAGAMQGNATLAAELTSFDYFDAAAWTLQGPAPHISLICQRISDWHELVRELETSKILGSFTRVVVSPIGGSARA